MSSEEGVVDKTGTFPGLATEDSVVTVLST
jgi:hypothetical protein